MIHPSYTELINAVNERSNQEEPLVRSRYSIVLAAARRARQLISDDKEVNEPLVPVASDHDKPLSIAVQEIYEGKVNILPEGTSEEDLHIIEDVNIPESVEDILDYDFSGNADSAEEADVTEQEETSVMDSANDEAEDASEEIVEVEETENEDGLA